MTFKAKAKGNSFERQTANILSDWTKEKFWRIPNSGALRWNGKAWVYGDLSPGDGFPVSVFECKHHRSVDLDDAIRLTPQPSNILGFWAQVLDDCDRCTAETGMMPVPILVFKQNRRPPRICLLEGLFKHINVRLPYIVVRHPDFPSFVVLDLLDFCKGVTYHRYKVADAKFRAEKGAEHEDL